MAHKSQVAEFVGSGYDVFGEYASPESLKGRIFDIKYAERYTRSIPHRELNGCVLEGNSRMEYQNNLALRVAGTAEYPMFPVSVEAGFGLKRSNLDFKENGFMTVNFCKKLEISKLEPRDKEKKYMHAAAWKDLMRANPDVVIDRYGGYVVGGVVSGGRWTINALSNTLHHQSAKNLQAEFKAAAESFMKGELRAGLERKLEEEEAYLEYRVKVVGGDIKHSSLDEINQWKDSVTERTAQVTDFTTLIPIWDFVSDKDRKQQLKEAFERHAEKQTKQFPFGNKLPSILQKTYTTRQIPCSRSRGLGSRKPLALYYIPDDSEWKYVGHSGNDHSVLALREMRSGYGILKKPSGWEKVWSCQKYFPSKKHYSCWMPVAPAGYVALGVFCRFGIRGTKRDTPPSDEETKNFVVVHKSYVEKCDIKTEVWSSKGSGARSKLVLGKLKHHALWPCNNRESQCYTLSTLPCHEEQQEDVDGAHVDILDRHMDQLCSTKTHRLDQHADENTISGHMDQEYAFNGHSYQYIIATTYTDQEHAADHGCYFNPCMTQICCLYVLIHHYDRAFCMFST